MKRIRNFQVGGLVFFVGVSFALWNWILSPLMAIPAAHDANAASLRSQVVEVETEVLELSSAGQDASPLTDEATMLNTRLPESLDRFTFEQQLRLLLSDNGLPASNLRITGAQSLGVIDAGTGAQEGVYASPVTLTVGADNPGVLVQVANKLHGFERAFAVKSVNVSANAGDSDNPEALSTPFVLTVTGQIFAAPSIPTVLPPAPSAGAESGQDVSGGNDSGLVAPSGD